MSKTFDMEEKLSDLPVVLRHPGVNVVAAVAEVSDFLGQQFYSLR